MQTEYDPDADAPGPCSVGDAAEGCANCGGPPCGYQDNRRGDSE